MKIDLNRYRKIIKPLVELYLKRNPEQKLHPTLSILAQTTNCHIIAVGYYIAELRGMEPELKSILDMLEQFYQLPEIENFEPSDINVKGESDDLTN